MGRPGGGQIYHSIIQRKLLATTSLAPPSSRPALIDGFTRRTFNAMIEGAREPALAAGVIDPERFHAGIRDLHRTTEADGVFCYTFFKAVAHSRDNR